MESSNELETGDLLVSADDSMHIDEDTSIHDSILNTDDVVRNLIESTINNPETISDHDSSLVHTNDAVNNLVENTVCGEVLENNSIAPDSSLHTDDIIRGLAENETINANIDARNEVSSLESVTNVELQDPANTDNAQASEEDSFIFDFSLVDTNEPDVNSSAPKSDRLCQLPPYRIKSIMKSDPEINVVNAEITFLISKSCELFLQWLGKEIHARTLQQKKKTIQKRDLDLAINENLALEFLDGALD